MSNTLTVEIFEATPVNELKPSLAIVVAKDSYGTVVREYDSLDSIYKEFSSEKELLKEVVSWEAFADCSHVDDEGTIFLEGISHVEMSTHLPKDDGPLFQQA